MISEASTPGEYLESLPDDWKKETLLALRTMILDGEKDLEEKMNYKMLGYGKGKDILFQLNAQMHYVSLYVGNINKTDPDGALTAGIDTGKGCMRFKKKTRPEETRIEEFIRKTKVLWRAGKNMDC